MIAIAFAIAGMWYMSYLHREAGHNRFAAFWATVAEPLIYRSQDIADVDVVARAENARRMLAEHGNKYLLHTDIYCFVWGADPENPGLDFQQWADLTDRRAIKIREEFRKEKSKHSHLAAARILAGQTIDFDDIGDNES